MAPKTAMQNARTDAGPTITDLVGRDVRALTEYMTVLSDVGQVRGADDLYLVVSEREYVVDTREGTCTCPDAEYNLGDDEECKHEKRAKYATGKRPIPVGIDPTAIDPQLGEHVEGPKVVATDGGQPETDADGGGDEWTDPIAQEVFGTDFDEWQAEFHEILGLE